MGITVANQTMVFLGSLCLGAALGLLHDIFRISRLAFPLSAGVVLAEDLLFSLLCAVSTFGYLLGAVEGQLRFFILVGEGLGAVLYSMTLGSLIMEAAQGIITVCRRLLRLLYRVFCRPVLCVLGRLTRFLGKITAKGHTYFKKQGLRAKIRLKERRALLYNLMKKPQQPQRRKRWRWRRQHGKEAAE